MYYNKHQLREFWLKKIIFATIFQSKVSEKTRKSVTSSFTQNWFHSKFQSFKHSKEFQMQLENRFTYSKLMYLFIFYADNLCFKWRFKRGALTGKFVTQWRYIMTLRVDLTVFAVWTLNIISWKLYVIF